MRGSKVKYNPALSVEENAKISGVSVNTIRWYIKQNKIDRRSENALVIIRECREYLKTHKKATRNAVAKALGYSHSTVSGYWSQITGEAPMPIIDSEKAKDRQSIVASKLRGIPVKDIQEYLNSIGDNISEDRVRNKKELWSEVLAEIPLMFSIAEQDDITPLRKFLFEKPEIPMLFIGSGGANGSFISMLYGMNAGVGKDITPLQFSCMSDEAIRNSRILLLSKGGRNDDIVYAAKRAVAINPENTACLTFRDTEENRMVKVLKGTSARIILYNHPEIHDGFTSLRGKFHKYGLILRAFTKTPQILPQLRISLKSDDCYKCFLNNGEPCNIRLKQVKHLIVLYNTFGEPVASDMESVLAESGVCSVQKVDFRNYCHGRFIFASNHTESDKHSDVVTDTAIVLLVSPRDKHIANQIRQIAVPSRTPIVLIETEHDSPMATLDMLVKTHVFMSYLCEQEYKVNPYSPPNYSNVDKRFPINGMSFITHLLNHDKFSLKPIQDTLVDEYRERLNTLLEEEHRNAEAIAKCFVEHTTPTKESIFAHVVEEYDASTSLCYAFRRKEDLRKDEWIPFGNMNTGFPFAFEGVEMPTSESAYICGLFSDNTQEHIAVQNELLTARSGYDAKKDVRHRYEKIARRDWEEFNVEWMLYCVWQKVQGNKEFRDILMAIPKNAIIVEDSSFQTGATSSFWGCKNEAKKEFSNLVSDYVSLTMKYESQKAQDEEKAKYTNDFCNYGKYVGCNAMGKILMIVKKALHDGVEPDIDYQLLRSKDIYFLGKRVDFERKECNDTIDKSKVFVSPNGKYDIVVCHNTMDAQMYINETGYAFPSWCYVTSQGSYDKYTSHSNPLGEKGGVLIIFFRKDSNSTQKSDGGSISMPLLCDDYAISVFSLTTDYKKEDGKLFVRSVTNRYNLTKDIYAATKPSDIEESEVRMGLDAISKATGMDVEQFCVEHTPAIRDKREDYSKSLYEEKYNDGKVTLLYPRLNIPRDKKSVLCTIKDSYGDDVAYDIQPSGAVHPHGCPHDTMNDIINELPDEAIRILRELYPRYVGKLSKNNK